MGFKPTHQHADGGQYEYVEHGFHKHMEDSDWHEAVFYRGRDGVLRGTSPARWEKRFTAIPERWITYDPKTLAPDGNVRIRMNDGWESTTFRPAHDWRGWHEGMIVAYMPEVSDAG